MNNIFQSHFNDANDFVEVEEQNRSPSAPVADPTANERRQESRFWFVDNID